MPNTRREDRPRVLFVGGYGRSGSTMLDMLLDRVPGITAVGEFRHLFGRALGDNELCSCGSTFNDCEYWRAVIDRAFPHGFDRERVDRAMRAINRIVATPQVLHPALRTPSMRAHCRVYGDAFLAAYRAVLAVSGDSVVVDSSKYPLHGLFLASMPDVDLVAMLLVRDPRAVAHSWQRRRQRPEVHWEHREMPRHSALRSAFAWNLSNQLTERISKTGVDLRVQRYEDLVAEPLATLEQIASFALGRGDMGLSDTVFDGELGKLRHTIAGNPVRLGSGRIEVRADVAWETEMGRRDRAIVDMCCARQMRRYGYRSSRTMS
jgi:Sulfotransferase family